MTGRLWMVRIDDRRLSQGTGWVRDKEKKSKKEIETVRERWNKIYYEECQGTYYAERCTG